jgi:hypothetical protein
VPTARQDSGEDHRLKIHEGRDNLSITWAGTILVNEDLSAREGNRKSASVASCPTREHRARIERGVVTDARRVAVRTGTTGSEGLLPRLDLPFPEKGISWETRPRLVHGMISSAGLAVRAAALSIRCCDAGERPGGTWSWPPRLGTP